MALSDASGYLSTTQLIDSGQQGQSGGTTTGTSNLSTKTTATPTLTNQGLSYANMISGSNLNNLPTFLNYNTPTGITYTAPQAGELQQTQYGASPNLSGVGNVRGAQDISQYLNAAKNLLTQGATGTTQYAQQNVDALTKQFQETLPQLIAQLAPQLTGLGAGISQKLLGEQVGSNLANLNVNTAQILQDAYNQQKANQLAAGQAMGGLSGYVNQASGINQQADIARNQAQQALNQALIQRYGQESQNVAQQNAAALAQWQELLRNAQVTSQGQLAAQVAANEATDALNRILLGQNQLGTQLYGTQVGAQQQQNALYADLARALVQQEQQVDQTGTTTGSQAGTTGTTGQQRITTQQPLDTFNQQGKTPATTATAPTVTSQGLMGGYSQLGGLTPSYAQPTYNYTSNPYASVTIPTSGVTTTPAADWLANQSYNIADFLSL